MGIDIDRAEFERFRTNYYSTKTAFVSSEEREQYRVKAGRTLFDAYYNRITDSPAYLDEIAQWAYLDDITRLAKEHGASSSDPEISMLRAAVFVEDHKTELSSIAAAVTFKRRRLLPPEQQKLYDLYELKIKYDNLSQEDRHRIAEKERSIGIEHLPPEQRDLFKRWEINKFRGNWFAGVTGTIRDLARDGFMDDMDVKDREDLVKRARDLDAKVTQQRADKVLNKIEDVREGDALIQEALEQLFYSIKELEGDERKKELKKLLGLPEEEKTTDQSPRT
ncbi:MAG: hypothetical protein AAB855_04945 [Patescibacteria group bacterium]